MLKVLNRGLWSSQPQFVVAVLTKKPPVIMTSQSESGFVDNFVTSFCIFVSREFGKRLGTAPNGATCIENTLEECDDVFDECCENVSYKQTLKVLKF